MAEQRRTKKVIILEDIIRKIASGQIRHGSFFPAARELARNYGISPRTAGTIIHELSSRKLLLTSPGRRSLVAGDNALLSLPKFQKPIGIIVPDMELMQESHWREWLFRHIQDRLADDGRQFISLPEVFDETAISESCSGFIVAGELLQNFRWELLQQTGLPCVRLSFFRPHPNTVYVDYRPALDKIALYLAMRKCRRVILLACCERESKYSFNWFSEIGFIKALQDYNIDEKGFHRVVITGNEQRDIDNICALITATQDKIAFLACNPTYNQLITGIMKRERQQLGSDYELISLSYAPEGVTSGRHVDLRCPEIVENMLDILYTHRQTGEPQLAKIIYADFISDFS